ncbi:DinB/UmuC family translesion DNA polymerase [Sporosarcina sp. ACRSL]|uniref:DinB/UmuC family translesion DNA polymerase n=1 Tax=Sporosarcina sp. ACRSL TaxID=2918215 RepID=UPI00351D1404
MHYPVGKLEKRFGVLGREWFLHSWGIDTSIFNGLFIPYNSVDSNVGKVSKTKGYGRVQTLIRDYTIVEAKTILLELYEETMRQVRLHKFVGKIVSITVNYSRDVAVDRFNRSMTVQEPFMVLLLLYVLAL